MEFKETEFKLKDGRTALLRSPREEDAEEMLQFLIKACGETDFLLTYADECTMTAEDEACYLKGMTEDPRGIEILAEVDDMVVGSAGVSAIGAKKEKVRHRAEFGISVIRDFWGIGIGRALTRACIACARRAGYAQLELDVVAENASAISLYGSEGFVEYGRNPKGFLTREGRWQELVLMRLELD